MSKLVSVSVSLPSATPSDAKRKRPEERQGLAWNSSSEGVAGIECARNEQASMWHKSG
jgi:hypothetical protein